MQCDTGEICPLLRDFPPVVDAGYDGYKAKTANKYEIHAVLNAGPMAENTQRRNTFCLCAPIVVWSACAVLFIGGIYQKGGRREMREADIA